MIVQLADTSATVNEADDCRRLHVVTELTTARAHAALLNTGIGTPIGPDQVLLDIAALRSLARSAATRSDWDDQWDRMVDYARGRDWLSPDERGVLAHVEYTLTDGSTGNVGSQ